MQLPMPEIPAWLAQWLFALLGLTFGSFFNVLIYRVPRDLPIAFPPSHCPNCSSPIRPWHNVPVLGWLMLGGRCKDCRTLISIQYPLVEALCGVLGVLAVRMANPDLDAAVSWGMTLPMFWMMVTLVPIAAVDFPYQLIPDTVTIGGIVVGVLSIFLPGGIEWQRSLLSIAIAGGGLFAFGWLMGKLLKRDAMGFGDVKLLAGFGAMMGWEKAMASLMAASFLALACMVPWRLLRSSSQREPLAFGPFIGVMGPVMLWKGDAIVEAYFRLMLGG